MAKLPKKPKKEEQKNDLIVQHNHLIEARYHLTLQEKRLMCWLASQVKQTDKDFKEHELSIKEFAELINVKGDHLYKTLDIITHKLMQKIITIRELKKKGFTRAALLGGAKYYEGQGSIKLSFHPYLKPYMLQIKERFTKISLRDVLGLRSVHSIRIYELLKQYESIGSREVSLNDLRGHCGIKEEKYKNFNDFKRFVLEISKKEIDSKTDIFINYEEIKTSRKVTSICFTIQTNPTYGSTHFEKAQQEKADVIAKELQSKALFLERLMEYGITNPAANRIVKTTKEGDMENALKAVEVYRSKHDVKNPKAVLLTALKEKWKP